VTVNGTAINRAGAADDLRCWLRRHKRAHPAEIELGLERVREVALRIGLLPAPWPVVTVAGTNGKGSTVALLESILREHGCATASYTSPHIHRYNERIRVGGECAGDAALCEAFEVIERQRGDISLSFFEVGTLAALWHFHRCSPDVVILETGLGGRLDAVNIVHADVAVITGIGIDHTEWLGSDRESIAAEKAGIARPGRPCIYGDPQPPRGAIEQLTRRGVAVERFGVDFNYRKHEHSWDFVARGGGLENLPPPALYGEIQLQNACCALAALAHLRGHFQVAPDAVRRGLANVQLHGRFQIRRVAAPDGERLHIFDIAHNPHGAEVMAGNLRALDGTGRLHAVFSMLSSKDVEGVVRIVAPLVDCWYLGEAGSSDALPLAQLCEIVRRHAGAGTVRHFPSVAQAYREAASHTGGGERLLVFGSMLTVAEALAGTAPAAVSPGA